MTASDPKKFVLSYVVEYLNDELPAAIKPKYNELLQNQEYAGIPEKYRSISGQIQMVVQKLALSEKEQRSLHELVVDTETRHTQEIDQINQVERTESLSNLKRGIGVVSVIAVMILAALWYFTPEKREPLDVLQTLTYESLAMEDDSRGRINFPTNDINEVANYFAADKSLKIKPKLLTNLPSGWNIVGATILDYEVAKVIAVQYNHVPDGEKMFHYMMAGSLANLPKASETNEYGIVFQSYASDELNVVAWSNVSGMLELLIGRRSIQDLAKIAGSRE